MAGFLAAALAATIAVAPLTEVAVKLGLVAAGAANINARVTVCGGCVAARVVRSHSKRMERRSFIATLSHYT